MCGFFWVKYIVRKYPGFIWFLSEEDWRMLNVLLEGSKEFKDFLCREWIYGFLWLLCILDYAWDENDERWFCLLEKQTTYLWFLRMDMEGREKGVFMQQCSIMRHWKCRWTDDDDDIKRFFNEYKDNRELWSILVHWTVQ